jgi:DNA-binding beta-propeller fold protein YncE
MNKLLQDPLSTLFNVNTQNLTFNNENINIGRFIFSPDGTYGLFVSKLYFGWKTHCIFKINKNKEISIFAGSLNKTGSKNGPKEQSLFNSPANITFSPDGTFLLVSDLNYSVRKICLITGQVTSLIDFYKRTKKYRTKDSYESSYQNYISHIIFSQDGTFILLSNPNSHCVFKMCLKTGKLSIFTGIYGQGSCSEDKLNHPCHIANSPDGKHVIVCNILDCSLKQFCIETKEMSYFTGNQALSKSFKYSREIINKSITNGPTKSARFKRPFVITFSRDNKFALVCDDREHCISKICMETKKITTFAGIPLETSGNITGPKEQIFCKDPRYLTFSNSGKFLFICANNKLQYMKIAN